MRCFLTVTTGAGGGAGGGSDHIEEKSAIYSIKITIDSLHTTFVHLLQSKSGRSWLSRGEVQPVEVHFLGFKQRQA
jgi:hypothetical protein